MENNYAFPFFICIHIKWSVNLNTCEIVDLIVTDGNKTQLRLGARHMVANRENRSRPLMFYNIFIYRLFQLTILTTIDTSHCGVRTHHTRFLLFLPVFSDDDFIMDNNHFLSGAT